MASPSNIVKTILAVAPAITGASPTADWGAHISKMPSTPAKAIVLFDSGGTPPNPALLLDFPSVQVQVRGGPNDNAATYAKAKEVKDRMIGLPSQTVLGDRLNSVGLIGDITFVGRDENDQPIYAVNLRLIVEPATNSLTNRIPI